MTQHNEDLKIAGLTLSQIIASAAPKSMLADAPKTLAALERSIARQEENRARKAQAAPENRAGVCPHCGTAGRALEVAGRVFRVKEEGCCELSLYDDALAALRYFAKPTAQPGERSEAGREYNRLKAQIKDPVLLDSLGAEAANLAQLKKRVSAEGGYCQGFARPGAPEGLRVVYVESGEDLN